MVVYIGGEWVTQYRINFWEGGKQYTTVISASNATALRQSLKQQYNRFTMEEIC